MIIGIANGCFDMLHAGHIELLAEARAQCDQLVVAINNDASVKRLKGCDRPINNCSVRAMMLLALRSVDDVRVFDTEDDLRELIREIEPQILFKGSDYKYHPAITGSVLVRKVVIIDTPTKSSTWAELRKRGRL